MNAAEVLARIAPSAAAFNPATHDGFIERRYARSVNLTWKSNAYTINANAVICSRTKRDGGTWYGYTLDPFGPEVSFSACNEVARAILENKP